ncbi:MAG: hypothetical protein MI922_03350 [Bacteroidales bacterium]|nr:hypothetical protein [Bacteroidales bacterium]
MKFSNLGIKVLKVISIVCLPLVFIASTCDYTHLIENTTTAEKEILLANYLISNPGNNFNLNEKPQVYELISTGYEVLGYLCVGNSYDSIFVSFTTTKGGSLFSTMLFVGEKDLVPRDENNQINVAEFPHAQYHDMGEQTYIYHLPLPAEDTVCIFANAVIRTEMANQTNYQFDVVWSNSHTGVEVINGESSTAWTDSSLFSATFKSDQFGGFSTYIIPSWEIKMQQYSNDFLKQGNDICFKDNKAPHENSHSLFELSQSPTWDWQFNDCWYTH